MSRIEAVPFIWKRKLLTHACWLDMPCRIHPSCLTFAYITFRMYETIDHHLIAIRTEITFGAIIASLVTSCAPWKQSKDIIKISNSVSLNLHWSFVKRMTKDNQCDEKQWQSTGPSNIPCVFDCPVYWSGVPMAKVNVYIRMYTPKSYSVYIIVPPCMGVLHLQVLLVMSSPAFTWRFCSLQSAKTLQNPRQPLYKGYIDFQNKKEQTKHCERIKGQECSQLGHE